MAVSERTLNETTLAESAAGDFPQIKKKPRE
jgi:hypothetical protein